MDEKKFRPRTAEDDRQDREKAKNESFAQTKESFADIKQTISGHANSDKLKGKLSMGTAVASLALGIAAMSTGLFFIGAVLGVMAIRLGIKYRKQKASDGNGLALAGIICGAIGILGTIASICIIIFTGSFIINFNNKANDMKDSIFNTVDTIKDSQKDKTEEIEDKVENDKTDDSSKSDSSDKTEEDDNASSTPSVDTPTVTTPPASTADCDTLKKAYEGAQTALNQSQSMLDSMKNSGMSDSMIAQYKDAVNRAKTAVDSALAAYNSECQ
ncbi:MAG: DUF4190 domain-containing protein [Candidatus Nomurabacteria bacterium]|jgi:hypothetical protein|nr:DUF4190 domain-containing protein [Candidatus Nomurabacteria bacterium]